MQLVPIALGKKQVITYVTFQNKCSKVCTKYVSSIERRKNYSNKWIAGTESVCASNVRDHAQNDQHTQAMHVLRRDYAKAS